MKVRRVCPVVSLVLCFVANAVSAEPSFEKQVQPFFAKYCFRCHNDKKQEGEFRLDTLARDFTDESTAQRWGEVIFRMNSAEMPPKDEPLPNPDELGRVVEWLSARVSEGQVARMAKRGAVSHYRLSRDEYAFTVYDLLGVHYDVHLPGAFNEDPRWHGFERIGSLLSLSPSHVERYLRAAETVLERAFPERPVEPRISRSDANGNQVEWLKEQGIEGRVRWLLWPEKSHGGLNIRHPGRYRIRIQLSGLRSLDGRLPHLSIWNDSLKQSVFDRDVNASEDHPTTLEFELVLSPGGYQLVNEVPRTFNPVGNHTLNVLNGGGSIFIHSRENRFTNPTGYKLFTDDGRAIHPTLIVDWFEWEGPLTTASDLKKRDGLVPVAALTNSKPPTDQKQMDRLLDESQPFLKRFAERAWRRPVADAELTRYVEIIAAELAAGENFRSAYRAAMVGVLTSRNFYYIVEGSARRFGIDSGEASREQGEGQPPNLQLNDWEIASRLSYFLWGSMPDDELFTVARRGELTKPNVLRKQLARMLADGKTQRFIEAFPRQWLQLHKVGMFPPDPKLYPDYDNWLEQSMVLETTHFFGEVLAKNLSLREFLISDWTMVNPRLAMHYQLPPLKEPGFQRVALRPEHHRGGLLSQASILSLTSDGARHRPVHRGVWISEAMFARTPPPPPPNVEPLEPTPSDEPKATIRDQLEAHTTHTTCASCHRKIDPLGFAFDNYDAIGRWRTEEIVTGGKGVNPPIKAHGLLPDGRKFDGPDQFKQRLADDIDRFAEAFVEQLATFALRRVMTIDDAAHIQAIAEASQADGNRLRAVIEHLVTSELFQKR